MTLNDFSPARIEAWLDDHGRGAWIAAIVLGFIAFWPLGLALLLWMLWRGKAGSRSGGCRSRSRKASTFNNAAFDNAAFAAHHEETLRRLDEDARAFEDHLRAQAAERDREAFEAFMRSRSRVTPPASGSPR
ncbi:MAG: protein of unknown function DUF2852 [Saliniramus fredricksonii]|uniref:DUF2852 domain-containing protein n=1 Tax=Saliniramus fredricksonii TaxID=1653334 RepID=A0A0P8BK26_9HYPH|nr:DUF2852 domain-containing protein [Saliniramus fredricksonii]KPQ09819.1 MAG: protein of unknown function DUF2852 [Saliniramus fredricksonii]SCC82136.1 Protein of unknown function [Saliniramus fredricksonii]